jgi:hypothetical protein
MFPTTITINNVSDLQKVMSVLYPTTGVVEIADTSRDVKGAAAQVEKPRKSKPEVEAPTTTAATQEASAPSSRTAEVVEAAAPAPSTSKPEPQPDTAQAAGANSAGDAQPVDYKTTAEAVTKLSRAKGRDAAVAVLKSFGADKLPDVKPEQFADVIAACQAAMGD